MNPQGDFWPELLHYLDNTDETSRLFQNLVGNFLTCYLLTYDVYCCHGNREMKGCFLNIVDLIIYANSS